ncbi:MAG: hypothetical protein WCK06_09830 [Actinomycetota bacterium]
MSDYTVKRIDEMEATFGGGLRRARASLGANSFGMAVEEFPPGFDRYPDHDHLHDRQEEIYVVLAGSAAMTVDGEEFAIDTETMVRVGPSAKRTLVAGPDGLRLLVLGGVPGEAYEAPEWSESGAPDPMAS